MTDLEPGMGEASGASAPIAATPAVAAISPLDDEGPAAGHGRQIVVIFLVIGLISIAFMQFHAAVPGMDQLIAVTPVVLALIVVVTLWLLYRQARRR